MLYFESCVRIIRVLYLSYACESVCAADADAAVGTDATLASQSSEADLSLSHGDHALPVIVITPLSDSIRRGSAPVAPPRTSKLRRQSCFAALADVHTDTSPPYVSLLRRIVVCLQ